MKVKICGLTNIEDAAMCEELGADALGFVHIPGRARSRDLSDISRICSSMKSATLKVLVCRPYDVDAALKMLSKSGVDVLQLYSLGPYEMDRLGEQGVRLFRVVQPTEPRAEIFAACSEALVFEDGTPGTGSTYDYSTVPVRLRARAFIAGGLSPDNVAIARALNPYGVDVSSGVEKTAGAKDRSKVEEFIRRSHQ